MPVEPLIDAKAAAEILQCHPKTVLILTRSRGLPFIRVGYRFRFRASDLERWIVTNTSVDPFKERHEEGV